MNTTLLRALIAAVPVATVLAWSTALFVKRSTVWSALQLLGAACLSIVVAVHICEALQLFPWFRWGEAHSVGHYVDLTSAIVGVAALPLGYVFHRREQRSA